jgi:hypothetical protein
MIHKTLACIIVLLMLFTVVQNTPAQQVGTTCFQFLKVNPDVRSTGMGDALASTSKHAMGMFGNPAVLTDIPRLDVGLSLTRWFFDTHINAFAAAFKLGDLGTLGVHGMMVDLGEIEETTVSALGYNAEGAYNPGLTGRTIKPSSMVVGLTFARNLTNKFALGLTAKWMREDLVESSASGIAFDFGLQYQTGFRSIVMSAVMRNFGPDVKFEKQEFPLPQTMMLGFATDLLASKDAMLFDVAQQKLTLAFNMAQPRDFDQQYHFGLEYALMDKIFLRAGYKMNFDEEGLCYGGGIALSLFRLDYSFNSFGDYLENVHRFSFGFVLN